MTNFQGLVGHREKFGFYPKDGKQSQPVSFLLGDSKLCLYTQMFEKQVRCIWADSHSSWSCPLWREMEAFRGHPRGAVSHRGGQFTRVRRWCQGENSSVHEQSFLPVAHLQR